MFETSGKGNIHSIYMFDISTLNKFLKHVSMQENDLRNKFGVPPKEHVLYELIIVEMERNDPLDLANLKKKLQRHARTKKTRFSGILAKENQSGWFLAQVISDPRAMFNPRESQILIWAKER